MSCQLDEIGGVEKTSLIGIDDVPNMGWRYGYRYLTCNHRPMKGKLLCTLPNVVVLADQIQTSISGVICGSGVVVVDNIHPDGVEGRRGPY